MQCSRCSFDNPSGARYCGMCGMPLGSHCARCGAELPAGFKFCSSCGAPATGSVSAPAPARSEAERRQMTVMLCDLAESTSLSERLDPEELRDVIHEYQAICCRIIRGYEGFVARYVGDGILAYFCYPHAHEDDAQRAVRAGLAIVREVRALGDRMERARGFRVAVRIGIHTGLLLLEAVAAEGQLEQAAVVGRTPNLASRIQGVASPDSVVMSADTYRLVRGFVECVSLGFHSLKGIAEPVHVYQAVAESTARDRLEAEPEKTSIPIAGRQREIELLLERWRIALAGKGQVVVLSGDPGIGKSRLIRAFADRIEAQPHERVTFHCSAYFQNSPLHPVTDFLNRWFAMEAARTDAERLACIEAAVRQRLPQESAAAPLLAELLAVSASERYAPLELTPKARKKRALALIATMLLEGAGTRPLLIVVEDLHWADPSTLEFLEPLIAQVPLSRALLLIALRPQTAAVPDTGTPATTIVLPPLVDEDAKAIVDFLTHGKALPREVMEQVLAKADGNPLFVEELTKAVIESDLLAESGTSYVLQRPLKALSIPSTLQDSLMGRLDRMGTARRVGQVAGTIGRVFSRDLLAMVLPLSDSVLDDELERLVRAGVLLRRVGPKDVTYVFSHALLQEAIYQSLLRSTRQQYHQLIAEALEERYQDIARSQPEVLAHHFTEACLSEKSVRYWISAGRLSVERSANEEAIAHFRKGIEVCAAIPGEATRSRLELNLQMLLGSALAATKGYANQDTERAYLRARELCGTRRLLVHRVPLLVGLYGFHVNRGKLSVAEGEAQECFEVAEKVGNPRFRLHAHMLKGDGEYWRGHLAKAREHLEQAVALYDGHRPMFSAAQEPIVQASTLLPTVLWLLGYPDQSLAVMQKAHSIARQLSHPYSYIWANAWAARLHQLRGEPEKVIEYSDIAFAHCSEQELQQVRAALLCMREWALVRQGRTDEALARMREAIELYRGTGAEGGLQHLYHLLADCCLRMKMGEEGLEALQRAAEVIEQTSMTEHEAELFRLRGELVLLTGDGAPEAERQFRAAISIARTQEARLLELRATASLARLLQSRGRASEARQSLAEIYGWFTEGFDTRDLQEAKELLSALE